MGDDADKGNLIMSAIIGWFGWFGWFRHHRKLACVGFEMLKNKLMLPALLALIPPINLDAQSTDPGVYIIFGLV